MTRWLLRQRFFIAQKEKRLIKLPFNKPFNHQKSINSIPKYSVHTLHSEQRFNFLNTNANITKVFSKKTI